MIKNSLMTLYPLFDKFFNKWDFNEFEKSLNTSVNDFSRHFNNFKGNKWIDCDDYWTLTINSKNADIEVDAEYLKYKYEDKKTDDYGTYTRCGDVKIPFPEGADTTTVRAEAKGNKIVVTVDRQAKVCNKTRKIEVK